MTPYLLLDIDGVLNTPHTRKKYGFEYISPEKCSLLDILVPLGIQVIVSSDWTCYKDWNEGPCHKARLQKLLKLPIVGQTDKSPVPSVTGNHPDAWKSLRTREILRWRDTNPDAVWCAVDDDCNFMPGHVVVTSTNVGLLRSHVDQLIKFYKLQGV